MTKLFRELVLHRYMKTSLELVNVQQATAKLAKGEVFCLLPAASWRNRADGEMDFPVNAVSSDPDCKFPTPPELSSLFSTNLICLKKISMCFQRELVWNWYKHELQNLGMWTIFCSVMHPPITKAFAAVQAKGQVETGPTFSTCRAIGHCSYLLTSVL